MGSRLLEDSQYLQTQSGAQKQHGAPPIQMPHFQHKPSPTYPHEIPI
jgi:hypothetical protein